MPAAISILLVLALLLLVVAPWLVIVAVPPLLFVACTTFVFARGLALLRDASVATWRARAARWVGTFGFAGARTWEPAVRSGLKTLLDGTPGIACACIKSEPAGLVGYVRLSRGGHHWHSVVVAPTPDRVALRVLSVVRRGPTVMESAEVFGPVGGCRPETCPKRRKVDARTHSWPPPVLS